MIRHNRLRTAALCLTLLALAACGRVTSKVVKTPENLGVIKQVTVLPAEVSSKEQNADAQALNDQWKKMAAEEIQSALSSKGIAAAAGSKYKVGCRIEAVYGNRALRAFVGYGAGSGHISVTVELRDEKGNVRYATNSEADLAVGSFGGDMAEVVRSAIRAAANDFATRL